MRMGGIRIPRKCVENYEMSNTIAGIVLFGGLIMLPIENSRLWKSALAARENDPAKDAREMLRLNLLKMRENCGILVQMIPSDCRGLTVHDITHLDALWEMADLIAGSNFNLNPAEAFVFGASVLIHDSGMSVASFPEGMERIRTTTEWKDTVASLLKRQGLGVSPASLSNPPQEIYDEAIFRTLRMLHAHHAEELPFAVWKHPATGREMRLLDDPHLQESYGKSIGRIAHSHHWDIRQVEEKLRKDVGGVATSTFPADWTLDEVKVACLLRCCDAAHIDQRRAPSLLFSLVKPTGVSKEHWSFQNKLQKPTPVGSMLSYSSGQDFTATDSSAWWLCYDAIRMIDQELKDCEALLQDSHRECLAVNRVFGAESPGTLARQIRTVGWRPVEASIKVTDPAYLAQTLGGKQLYGSDGIAPLRELMQNAVDAVRARRQLENRPPTFGHVAVTIERSNDDAIWLHVDDTGIGMSDRVLTSALLDFGRSFWSSSLLQEEFPGLISKPINPIGKYGIGFFSIFLLGENVRVVSRKVGDGADRTHVLEFESIGRRPLLRPAKPGELPLDFSTRISVRVTDADKLLTSKELLALSDKYVPQASDEATASGFATRVASLASSLDVEVIFRDTVSANSFHHRPSWMNIANEDFLRELYGTHEGTHEALEVFAPAVTTLLDADGNCVGRAALFMLGPEPSSYPVGKVSVEGFAYPTTYSRFQYLGVLKGEAQNVTRAFADATVSREVISTWASKQAPLLNRECFSIIEKVAAAQIIQSLGGDPGDLPYCFCNRAFLTYSEFRSFAKDQSSLLVPVDNEYHEGYWQFPVQSLGLNYLLHKIRPNILVADTQDDADVLIPVRFYDENYASLPVKISGVQPFEANRTFRQLWNEVTGVWGRRPDLYLIRTASFEVPTYKRKYSELFVELRRT